MGMFDWIFGTRRDHDKLEFARRVAVESRRRCGSRSPCAQADSAVSPKLRPTFVCEPGESCVSNSCGWSIVTVGCPSSESRRFSSGLWSFSPAILWDRCCVSSRLSRWSAEPRSDARQVVIAGRPGRR